MKLIDKFINLPILHPLLFAAYPVLALWLSNYGMLQSEVVVRPLLITIICAFLLFFFLKTLIKNPLKAAFLSTLIVLLYFSYGQIYSLIEDKTILGFVVGRHRYLASLWILILAAGSWAIIKFGANAKTLNRLLNLTSLVLLAIVLGQIGYLQLSTIKIHSARSEPKKPKPQPANIANLPDVYYIILDGYARDDVLQQKFQFDNHAFLKDLTDLGFVIPACTQSNYAYTPLSMAATLNMNYLDALGLKFAANASKVDPNLFMDYIQHSLVSKKFTDMGYKFVTFQVEYPWIQITDSDMFIKEEKKKTGPWKNILELSEFDDLLSQTTFLAAAVDLNNASAFIDKNIPFIPNSISAYQSWIERTFPTRTIDRREYDILINDLKKLEEVSKIPNKKFIYFHLLAPHDPYVLSPDGQFLPIKQRSAGYINQIIYLDQRMVQVVKIIQANSKIPPVIILQADHGWLDEFDTRTKILNAYNLPGGGNSLIYPNITPVNSFRIIFNYYFGDSYPLLADTSYYSPLDDRYGFKEVSPSCTNP